MIKVQWVSKIKELKVTIPPNIPGNSWSNINRLDRPASEPDLETGPKAILLPLFPTENMGFAEQISERIREYLEDFGLNNKLVALQISPRGTFENALASLRDQDDDDNGIAVSQIRLPNGSVSVSPLELYVEFEDPLSKATAQTLSKGFSREINLFNGRIAYDFTETSLPGSASASGKAIPLVYEGNVIPPKQIDISRH